VGFEAQKQAWLDAAEHVDAKWDLAFERAERVRAGYRRLLGDPHGQIALGNNTHELVLRFLSALPLRRRPRVITTDGEFHTIRRQLDRLAEEGLDVVKVSADPVEAIADRLVDAVDDRAAAVLVSSVLFRNARIVPGLDRVAQRCARVGAELLVDTYHEVNVIPMALESAGLGAAFVVGGGYKYCQLGEGNCFLRIPAGCRLRPAITGWFAEFSALADPSSQGVAYGEGADRFAGSTYDPVSHYRADAVFRFFQDQRLNPALLRVVSQHQVGLLAKAVDDLDADPAVLTRNRSAPLERIGGFLALRSPHAGELSALLKARGVSTDFRDDVLRLGPAPYLSDRQLLDAVGHLGAALGELNR
jgi:kynureninase